MKARHVLLLLVLTLGALLVHGYHPWTEDAEIYLPGIEKILNPALFPFNTQFFESHAHLTLFPNLIASSVLWSHLSLVGVLFVGQLLSIFLFLWACWSLANRCFESPRAQWCGVTLIASLLTIPVAGTQLYIMDQYLNPRNLVAFAGIFAISDVLAKKYWRAALFLIGSAVIHPLMPVFVLSFCVVALLLERMQARGVAFVALLPLGLFGPPSNAYHQVALTHYSHYVTRWHWYEWLGAIGPLVLLGWFSQIARSRGWRTVDLLCRAVVIYQVIYTIAAVAISIPPQFETLGRLQLMRSLYLTYILLILIGGGLLGEFVVKNHVWRWLILFLPLCGGMFYAQRQLFPASAHIEWPWAAPQNPWVQAFDWIRANTPVDAAFALDPYYMYIEGEDENGFRAIAERSRLADAVKDAGAVTMFPPNADEWLRQVQVQSGWRSFGVEDFHRLRTQYGVSWVVVQNPAPAGLSCLYNNAAVSVCRVE